MTTYAEAGVNIAKGQATIEQVKPKLRRTFHDAVLTDIGSFGALYDLRALMKDYQSPVLVQSVDGVGTKMMIAEHCNQFTTIGTDLVSACANDIVALGAKPLTLLDYVASDRFEVPKVAAIIESIADACYEEGIALIGGEMAEMPGVYHEGHHDLVGCVTGVLERDRAILGKSILTGDVVLALPSTGLHTNGYSLVRHILQKSSVSLETYDSSLAMSLAEALLKPHRNYTKPILALLAQSVSIKGMAHITGGGLFENIPRILPKGLSVSLNRDSWPILPIFPWLQTAGAVSEQEMFKTFNMGIGMILIVPPQAVSASKTICADFALPLYTVGRVVPGEQTVTWS